VLDLCVHDFDVLNWLFGAPKSVYARGRELKPGLWNNVHAIVDYGAAEGFVEGSEFMPEGYPFTAALRVVCEGGVVEFMFRAGGVSVEMGGANSLVAYEPGKSYALEAKPGDAYENQAAYFVDCVLRFSLACSWPSLRSLERAGIDTTDERKQRLRRSAYRPRSARRIKSTLSDGADGIRRKDRRAGARGANRATRRGRKEDDGRSLFHGARPHVLFSQRAGRPHDSCRRRRAGFDAPRAACSADQNGRAAEHDRLRARRA
jgi:hypothetical protein